MKSILFDMRMRDGSRHFAALPESAGFDDLYRHIGQLPGTTITGYITDHITEMWLDFTFHGHAFSINNQCGDYWLFVIDPACPDPVLQQVVEHCESLLSP